MMANIKIVKMEQRHLPGILELERGSFSDPWSENMFREEIKDDGRRLSLVLEEGNILLGYAIGWVVVDEFHLGNIAINKDRRGNGLGRFLLTEIMKQAYQRGCRVASLEVRLSNDPAIELYKKIGFKPIAIRKEYYRDEDALVMLTDIAQEPKC
jgi:ribosomal-protein-alanine N-acetyltransferase